MKTILFSTAALLLAAAPAQAQPLGGGGLGGGLGGSLGGGADDGLRVGSRGRRRSEDGRGQGGRGDGEDAG